VMTFCSPSPEYGRLNRGRLSIFRITDSTFSRLGLIYLAYVVSIAFGAISPLLVSSLYGILDVLL
jgi:hypothetical protein